jgi:hypothetical protein
MTSPSVSSYFSVSPLALQFFSALKVATRPRLLRREICVAAVQREPLLTGSDAVCAVLAAISGEAEFRRVRTLAYVDLNRNIGGRLDSDWKPRAGDSLMIISAQAFPSSTRNWSSAFTCAMERLNLQTTVTIRRSCFMVISRQRLTKMETMSPDRLDPNPALSLRLLFLSHKQTP